MARIPFAEVLNGLADEFTLGASAPENDQEIGEAFLKFVLARERLRHGAIRPGPLQADVDKETLEKLADPMLATPQLAFAEAVFRRLARNPAEAMDYFESLVRARRADQSKRAQAARPGRHDSLTRQIEEIVDGEPHITAAEVLAELGRTSGIMIADGEIRNSQDAASMPIRALKHRVSRAKKRQSR